jgi:hypothetical protein
VEKPTALEAGIQKVGSKIWILGRIRTLYSQSYLRGKNKLFCPAKINFFARFF